MSGAMQPVHCARFSQTAALALALVACGGRDEATPVPVAPPPSLAAGDDALARSLDAAAADDAARSPDAAPAAPVIPQATQQLITGVVADWSATAVTLQRWRRVDGAWRPDGDAWKGVIGKSGAAWGRGLHGAGAPGGAAGPTKREGDGKSPAGAFAIRGAYGYARRPPAGTQLPYTATTADWQCVDDPASHHYGQIVDRTRVAPDWTSAEAMRRADDLYRWVVDVAHNPDAAPGGGSCIFLHVWRGPESSTVGCTAMPAGVLASLITGLDPGAVYVLLPAGAYDALAAPWGLPPRS